MITIDPFAERDWTRLRAIYQDGIDTGQATFEREAPAWPAFDATHLPIGRLKASRDGHVAGWAALSPVSRRAVYAGVAELSIYVDRGARGAGVGSALLAAIVTASEAHGIWTLQASSFPENLASLRLQARFGFRVVGTRQRIAAQNGLWRDTLLSERRSAAVGIERP
ncbi:MAG: N-acetyltransferase [Rhodocyclaceae bacterium]|nr:N-acetyltransferase [Rhodocyclaceae bacterium]